MNNTELIPTVVAFVVAKLIADGVCIALIALGVWAFLAWLLAVALVAAGAAYAMYHVSEIEAGITSARTWLSAKFA